jgi:diadenosine tetraphosphate (Ap4A) HIT family hydrolase
MDLLPGHTLVVPKVHYADVYSIPDDALASLISSCKKHALRWREQVGSTGVNILNASGIDAEQSVFHFHFHLFPRFANDGYRAWPSITSVRRAKRCAPDFGWSPSEIRPSRRQCSDLDGWRCTPAWRTIASFAGMT